MTPVELTFLGTAAAEAFPALFCNCERCERARVLGGANLRCRSSALVNDDLLIDYGPDASAQCTRLGVDLTRITDLLLTHSHHDHVHVHDLAYRALGSRRRGTLGKLTIWANQVTAEVVHEQLFGALADYVGSGRPELRPTREEAREEEGPFLSLNVVEVEPGRRFRAGRYDVVALRASHNQPEPSLNFVVDDGSARLLYATDTGPWGEEQWMFLNSVVDRDGPLDCVALDCTVGEGTPGGHNSYDSFLEAVERLRADHLLSERPLVFAHHFSHQDGLVHDDVVPLLAKRGVLVAHDGLRVSFGRSNRPRA